MAGAAETTSAERTWTGSGRKRRGLVGWILGGLFALVIIGVFVIPLLFVGGWGWGHIGPGPYYTGSYYFPFFFFPFGFLIFLFVAFFVVRTIFWGFGWGRRGWYGYGHGHWRYSSDAREILRRRYASGEITKEQFDQMKKDLDEQPSS